MKKYRVLIWFPEKNNYYNGLFKCLNVRCDTECKDRSDFGFETDYYKQEDYEKIQKIFRANIIILYQISKKELHINIADDIVVWSYLDDVFGKFVMVGKDFFADFPRNNYLYLPLLNVQTYDIEEAMKLDGMRRKAIVAPFVPIQCTQSVESGEVEKDKFSCDISLILYRKRIGDPSFKYFAGLNERNSYSKDIMQLLGLLHTAVHKEILDRECIVTDMNWIESLLIKCFDKINIWQFVRNKELVLERWRRLVFYIINIQVYGNIIADWLIETDYKIKLYGGWNEKKYAKYSEGYIQDGSIEMYYANNMSKIGINSNPFVAVHRRTLSCIECGTMCLSAAAATEELDAKYNFSHYSHYFENGKSITIFHNKKELFDKIDYYLTHEKERKRIISAGQEVISEQNLNCLSVVNKAFDELIDRINENGEKVI